MHNRQLKILKLGVVLSLAFLLHGCIPYEKLVNFNDGTPTELLQAQYIPEVKKILIQTDDILSITVSTFDSLTAKLFNNPVRPAGSDGSFIGQGYLVDVDGFIEFPVLGKIKLKGLTREEAKNHIKSKLLTYLREPVVEVRFLNLHVSVMGEVQRPGLYTFPDEHFTVLEAITLAGDLTNLADRENIVVIREFDKVREFGKVDLSSIRAFESNYFYLAQNDIVYVKPLEQKTKVIQDPVARISAIASIVVSMATLIVALSTL
jgi:polysaccharide biosynthesis/export protein